MALLATSFEQRSFKSHRVAKCECLGCTRGTLVQWSATSSDEGRAVWTRYRVGYRVVEPNDQGWRFRDAQSTVLWARGNLLFRTWGHISARRCCWLISGSDFLLIAFQGREAKLILPALGSCQALMQKLYSDGESWVSNSKWAPVRRFFAGCWMQAGGPL